MSTTDLIDALNEDHDQRCDRTRAHLAWIEDAERQMADIFISMHRQIEVWQMHMKRQWSETRARLAHDLAELEGADELAAPPAPLAIVAGSDRAHEGDAA